MADLQVIQDKIYEIRGQRVMLDRDLAEMYGVTTSALNQAVKRNAQRFPEEFMFQMTDVEVENWKSQIVISNSINRIGKYVITICDDIQNKTTKNVFSLRFYRTRGGHAFISTQNPYRNTGLHLCCESICCDAYLPHDYDIRNSCRSP